jgi:hypothetical protein
LACFDDLGGVLGRGVEGGEKCGGDGENKHRGSWCRFLDVWGGYSPSWPRVRPLPLVRLVDVDVREGGVPRKRYSWIFLRSAFGISLLGLLETMVMREEVCVIHGGEFLS